MQYIIIIKGYKISDILTLFFILYSVFLLHFLLSDSQMSYRQGHNNVSRHNPGFVHSDTPNPNTPPTVVTSASATQQPPGTPITTAPPIYYHHHRGHKRGHSYGGPVSPAAAAFHHARLEARPSHPNTNTHQGLVYRQDSFSTLIMLFTSLDLDLMGFLRMGFYVFIVLYHLIPHQ